MGLLGTEELCQLGHLSGWRGAYVLSKFGGYFQILIAFYFDMRI
jgi:hypothetical protein